MLSNETVPAVYKKTVTALKDTGIDLIKELPSFNQIKSSIYRRRNKLNKVKKMSYLNETVNAVEIPAPFSKFMLADYNDESEGVRILIFCSNEARALLREKKIFFSDGTFKICPVPFTEVYTIHADLGSSEDTINVIPLIYALLSHKRKTTYTTLFSLIKSQIPDWNPSIFITDFEEAAIQAIADVFPNAEHQGCYYHFSNKLWRKSKQLGIKNKRKKRIVSLCSVLPLLPEDRITEGWEYVKSQVLDFSDRCDLDKFIKYMSFWMNPKRIKSWTAFGRRHRTTNVVEGWHRAINGTFKTRPATIFQFLKNIEEDAAFSSVKACQLKSVKRRANKQIENDAMIRVYQMQLINGNIDIPLFLEKLR